MEFTSLRRIVLCLTLCLTLAPRPTAFAADAASVTDVLDPATLDVTDGASSQRVQLAGIDFGTDCLASTAVARVRELVDGRPVLLETDSALSDQDQLGRRFVYVWLPDGRNLGEVLLSEGVVRAGIGATPPTYEESFAAAQASAANQRIGAWAPGACPPEAPQAGVEDFIKSTAQQGQVVTMAVDALHQRTISASVSQSALTQPEWRQATGYAVAQVRRSASLLVDASANAGSAQPLAQRFQQVGNELLVAVDAYNSAVDQQDMDMLQAGDARLSAAAAKLQPLMQELGAYAQRYTLGD